jgi:hypothetical protein
MLLDAHPKPDGRPTASYNQSFQRHPGKAVTWQRCERLLPTQTHVSHWWILTALDMMFRFCGSRGGGLFMAVLDLNTFLIP